VPPDADGETMEKLARTTGNQPERSDPSRLRAGRSSEKRQVMANSLPMTLPFYRKLSAAVVPLAPALIKRRLKQGKEDPARIGETPWH